MDGGQGPLPASPCSCSVNVCSTILRACASSSRSTLGHSAIDTPFGRRKERAAASKLSTSIIERR